MCVLTSSTAFICMAKNKSLPCFLAGGEAPKERETLSRVFINKTTEVNFQDEAASAGAREEIATTRNAEI